MKILLVLSIILLTSCMTPPVQQVRPVLQCEDCKNLTYYGPQLPAQEAPGVSMAKVIVGGITKVAGVAFAVDAIKSTSSTIANAGKVTVVDQQTHSSNIQTQSDPVIVTQPEPIVVNPVFAP